MNYQKQDLEFSRIVEKILENKEFGKTKEMEHHGVNRFDHSVKVAYYSYKVAKTLGLDYEQTARGGLLHDFFFSSEERTGKDKFISTFVHPKEALETAKEHFDLSAKEEDMIKSHMFPINPAVPRYMESWIVSGVDKVVAVDELAFKFRFKIKYAYSLLLLFMINFIR